MTEEVRDYEKIMFNTYWINYRFGTFLYEKFLASLVTETQYIYKKMYIGETETDGVSRLTTWGR